MLVNVSLFNIYLNLKMVLKMVLLSHMKKTFAIPTLLYLLWSWQTLTYVWQK